MKFPGASAGPKGDIALSGPPKTQEGDIFTNATKTQTQIREAELLYLHSQYQHSLQQYRPQEDSTLDTSNISKDISDLLDAVCMKHHCKCFMHETVKNFVCQPQCYTEICGPQ